MADMMERPGFQKTAASDFSLPYLQVGGFQKKHLWMERQVGLDNLKLRASYGTLGNQLLGSDYYPYISTMGTGSAPYMMSSGLIPYVSPAGLISPSLTWETVVAKNLGLDFTILNQKLDVSADIYIRDT